MVIARAVVDRPQFVRYVARRLPVVSLFASAAIAGVLTAVGVASTESLDDLLRLLRLGAVMLAASAALCLEDEAEVLTANAPVGRLARRLVAIVGTGLVALVLWIAIAVPAACSGGHLSQLPIGGLVIELLAMMAAGWMIAALIVRVEGVRGSGPKSAAVLVLLCLVTLVTPRTLHWLWTGPSPSWRIVHVRWTVIGLVSVGVCMLVSGDPARRPAGVVLHRNRTDKKR